MMYDDYRYKKIQESRSNMKGISEYFLLRPPPPETIWTPLTEENEYPPPTEQNESPFPS